MARSFVINVVIGLALLFLLHTPWVQRNQAVANARDAIITWQMARLTGVDNAANLAWIDIDESAHAAWGSSQVTRRDKVAALIAFALRGKPAVVVVDIDETDAAPGAPLHDAALQRILRAHERACAATSCPPVLLVRTFAPSTRYVYRGRQGYALMAQRSFLDAALGTSPNRPWNGRGVQWGSVGMDREPDLVVRRWRLWENACNTGGKAVITPSLMLLAAAIQNSTPLERVRAALVPHALLCEPASEAAASNRVAGSQVVTTLALARSTLTLSESGLDRRVFFRIPWTRANERPGLAVVLPAESIARDPRADAAILRGRIVVIGTSYAASGDLHMTPLGEMPGALVLINAINSLVRGDEIHDAGWGVTVGIELGLILVVSALFAALPAGIALCISLGLIVTGSLTIGFVAFNSGVWLDSVIPLSGVILHEVIARTRHRTTAIFRGRRK